MSHSTCELCPRPTRDEGYLCDDCGDRLATDLKDLADWLEDDLETSMSGTRAVQYGSGGAEPGLHVNYRAVDLYRKIHRALCDAVDHAIAVRLTNSSPSSADPPRTVRGMALWLTWRVDGLCLDPQGPKHADVVSGLVEKARDLVFWVPPERRFLGACELCGEGYVYAEGTADIAYCNRCASAFAADIRRDDLLAQLNDKLMTATEIARASTYLGLRDNRERVQARIWKWHERKRITSAGSEGTAPRFRFGDVYPLLLAPTNSGQPHIAGAMKSRSDVSG